MSDGSGSGRATRRGWLRAGAGALAAGVTALAGCAGGGDPAPSTETLKTGFEGDFEWETAADLPEGSEWAVAPSADRAADGEASLRAGARGHGGAGALWASTELDVVPGPPYEVHLAADALGAASGSEPAAHLLLAGAVAPPSGEEAFPAPGEKRTAGAVGGLRAPLSDAWSRYATTWESPAVEGESLRLAVGVAPVRAVAVEGFIDGLEVTAVPLRNEAGSQSSPGAGTGSGAGSAR